MNTAAAAVDHPDNKVVQFLSKSTESKTYTLTTTVSYDDATHSKMKPKIKSVAKNKYFHVRPKNVES